MHIIGAMEKQGMDGKDPLGSVISYTDIRYQYDGTMVWDDRSVMGDQLAPDPYKLCNVLFQPGDQLSPAFNISLWETDRSAEGNSDPVADGFRVLLPDARSGLPS